MIKSKILDGTVWVHWQFIALVIENTQLAQGKKKKENGVRCTLWIEILLIKYEGHGNQHRAQCYIAFSVRN